MCPGGPSNVIKTRPAAVCTACAHYEWAADAERLPGFNGAQCASFTARHVAAPPAPAASTSPAGPAPHGAPIR